MIIPRKRNPNVSLYVMWCESAGESKIGVSTNASQRAIELSRDLGSRVCIERRTVKIYRPCAFEVEAKAHKEFDAYRTHGEWFKIPPEHTFDFIHSEVLNSALLHLGHEYRAHLEETKVWNQ